MSIEDPTFGCGTFLPGVGPGNFPDFTGGGTIDGGGGEAPPGDVGGGIDIGTPPGPPRDNKPPGGNPTWPNNVDVPFNDPTGSWGDDQWPPTQGWDPKWEIIDIEILAENGAVPTIAGGLPYIPVVNSETGILSLPSIRTPTWGDNNPPKIIIIKLKWPAIPGGFFEPYEYTFTTPVTSTDLGGIVIVDGGIGGTEATGQDPPPIRGLAGGGTQADPTYGGTVTPPRTEYNDLIAYEIFQQQNPARITTIDPISWQPGTEILYVNVISAGNATPEPVIDPPGSIFINTAANFNSVQYPDVLGQTITYNTSLNQGGGMWGDPGARKVDWNSNTGVFELFSIDSTFLTTGTLGKPIGLEIVTRNPDFVLASDGSINIPDQVHRVKLIVKDGGSSGPLGEDDPDSDPSPLVAGGGGGAPGKILKNNRAGVLGEVKTTKVVDLNDPELARNILRKKPTGLQDSDVGFMTTAPFATMVPNDTGHTDIFAGVIDSNIYYVLKNRRNAGNWDSTRAAGVTPTSVYNSLRSDVKKLFDQILNYDGTALTQNQIYNMIGTRILDGSISRITLKYLKNLATSSKKRVPTVIHRSVNNTINEVAAAAIVDNNKFTLDPNKATGRMTNILPNWKTLATDIDQYIPLTIGGAEKRFYVNDDNTFITGSDVKIQDGNYVDLTRGGKTQRIFTKSEIDHAFILPESSRQKALSLLGADTGRTLEVSAPASLSGIEFDYSLTAPRQNFYVLSAVLSSITTTPSPFGSFLLKDSTIAYDLVDTSTTVGLDELNTYIKYKVNHRVFILDDEDLIFDYLDGTGKMTMKQTDILFDSPKTNKATPLLTRQIPWYILVYPTNRRDYTVFNDKSQFVTVGSDGTTTRSLKCRTTLVPEFNKGQTNKFVRIETDGKGAVDVLGNANTQTRITKITPTDTVFTTGYKKRNSFVAADSYTRTRKKTGFRLVKEIITELNTNYLLGLNAGGKIVTEFDVFSRLYLSQFNMLAKLENFTAIRDAIRNGLVAGVRVIPPISHADSDISYRSTLLLRRKEGASADTFTPIKATRNRRSLVPPTTTQDATSAPGRSPTTPS